MADPETFPVPEIVVGTELEISPSVATYHPDTLNWSVDLSGSIPYATGAHEIVTGELAVTGNYLTTNDDYSSIATDTTGALTITSGTGMSVSIGDNFTIMQPSGCQMRLEHGGAFVFMAPTGKDMLRIESDGRFIVKGTVVTTNLDVYRGFRDWLGRAGF